MHTLIDDLRWSAHAVRGGRRASLMTVALLALGIAAVTTVFAVVYRIVLEPLPVREPERLVALSFTRGDGWWVKEPPFSLTTRLAARLPALSGQLAGEARQTVAVDGFGDARRVEAALVTPDYFRVLGLAPAIGRLLDPGDHADGAAVRGAVLSHRWWRDHLGADPRAVGRTLTVFDGAYVVVGVLPPGYRGLSVDDGADLFLPRRACHDCESVGTGPEEGPWTERPATLFLRVPPGLDREVLATHAQAALVADREAFLARTPDVTPEDRLRQVRSHVRLDQLRSGISPVRERVRRTLWVLFGGAVLLLLLLSGNVAGLGLARAVERARAWQLRAALGATPGRLRRQAVLEGLLLALVGGGLGLGVAAVVVPRLGGLLPPALTTWRSAGGLAPAEWLFALGVAAATGVLAVAPALLWAGSAAAPPRAVAADRFGATAHVARTGRALVAIQIGLSVLLLGGAALFLRTWQILLAVPPGFDPSHVVTFRRGAVALNAA